MPDATLPNLIIAGVNKAGTTSLYAYLAQHPQIGASAVKETCHFLPWRYDEPKPDLAEYRRQFTHVADKPVRFESTPGYFYGGSALIQALTETLGSDLKIILIFREPVSRLISFFNFKKSTLELPADLTLHGYIDRCLAMDPADLRVRKNNPWFGVEGGLYSKYLPPWIDAFGDRLKILFTDDLHRDARRVLREIFTFVAVDTDPAEHIALTRENRGTGYRFAPAQRLALAVNRVGERFWRTHPKLKQTLRRAYYTLNGRAQNTDHHPAVIERMHAFYKPYNQQLIEQLNGFGVTRLPGWLSPVHAGDNA